MTTGDIPQISGYASASNTYGLGNIGQAIATGVVGNSQIWSPGFNIIGNNLPNPYQYNIGQANYGILSDDNIKAYKQQALGQQVSKEEKKVADKIKRRLVQVFIADPDERVPLGNAVLYSGTQHLTDATDQELFFEIDIKEILTTHNNVRVTLVDKKVKERVEYLEPVKVRDLKMIVVTVAEF